MTIFAKLLSPDNRCGKSGITVREQDGDPAHRYYARSRGFGAASWSPEAAIARVRLMIDAAEEASR